MMKQKAFLQFIPAFVLLFVGCTDPSNSGEPKHVLLQFQLGSNDLQLLRSDSCNGQICFDSLTSINQYYDFMQKKFTAPSATRGNPCICFKFMNDSNTRGQKIVLEKIPTTYGTIKTTVPNHSILQVGITDSAFVYTIGNESQRFSISSDTLNRCIKRLYLNEPDTSLYGEKTISLVFPNENVKLANQYLSQLVIGYVDAQRDICQQLFHKDLNAASLQEIKQLMELRPLRFNIHIKAASK